LPFNGSQGFYSPYEQRPGTLTTFGRWKNPLLTYFNIKQLTPALGGQYFLAEYGQGNWLFCKLCLVLKKPCTGNSTLHFFLF
jgi:hypothetical protein